MALGNINLSNVVAHCKQLPGYRDSLPIISMLQDIAGEEGSAKDIAEAISEIRLYFRSKEPARDDEPKKLPLLPQTIHTPELPKLLFFHQVTAQQMPEFVNVLRDCLTKIDTKGKTEWFCIYAAWRYLHPQDLIKGSQVKFFTDIDTLFPGLLKGLRTDHPDNRIYKPYTDMLSNEYKRWAVDNKKLPPMQVWRHSDWTQRYNNTKNTIEKMQNLVSTFYAAFAAVLKG